MIPSPEKVPAEGKSEPYGQPDVSAVQIRSLIHIDQDPAGASQPTAPMLAVVVPGSPAMQSNENRYRMLLDSMDQAFCVIEVLFDGEGLPHDYRFLEINALFEEQTGLTNVLGKRIREFIPHHEQHWFEVYGNVARTGEPIRFENSSRGMNRWFSVHAFREGGPESHKVACIFSDITAEKRAEFLTSLSQQLAVARSEEDVISVTVDRLGRHLNVDRCYFVECLESENRVEVSRNFLRGDSPSLEGRYNLFDFGGIEWWRRYSTGNFAVDDVETNPLTRDKLDRYRAMGVRAYAVQPFRREGEWTVILGVTELIPRKWTSEDLRLLDDVAARVWPLVQRARTDRELRESESFLQSVMGATADCIKVLDLEGHIEWMSENGQRLLEVHDFSKVRGAYLPDFYADDATRALAREAVHAAGRGEVGRFRGFCGIL